MFPIWVYVVVAAAIALLAFAIAQVSPGSGMIFVALTASMWTAYAARRGRRASLAAPCDRRPGR